jgi:P-type E1-E2 ATPase
MARTRKSRWSWLRSATVVSGFGQGDGVPVDGEVLEGTGGVDEFMVTGESIPAAKKSGDRLIGGTVNGTGSLIMRVDKIGADTMLARIVAMVCEAQRSRAPIPAPADKVSGCFVCSVLPCSPSPRGRRSVPPPRFPMR